MIEWHNEYEYLKRNMRKKSFTKMYLLFIFPLRQYPQNLFSLYGREIEIMNLVDEIFRLMFTKHQIVILIYTHSSKITYIYSIVEISVRIH